MKMTMAPACALAVALMLGVTGFAVAQSSTSGGNSGGTGLTG